MKTSLSINVNKVATLRNARGGNLPSVTDACVYLQQIGADGITVHPRPDERHIRYKDAVEIKKIITTEFNIEGNPKENKFIDLVLEVRPHQVTLVPDHNHQLTSDHGWDTIREKEFLAQVISLFKKANIRTSIFVDPDLSMIDGAKAVGTDRIELYTADYATKYPYHPKESISPYVQAAQHAKAIGLEINAGHDLSLENLSFFKKHVPYVHEVSIGHAFIADALYLGFKETVKRYQEALGNGLPTL